MPIILRTLKGSLLVASHAKVSLCVESGPYEAKDMWSKLIDWWFPREKHIEFLKDERWGAAQESGSPLSDRCFACRMYNTRDGGVLATVNLNVSYEEVFNIDTASCGPGRKSDNTCADGRTINVCKTMFSNVQYHVWVDTLVHESTHHMGTTDFGYSPQTVMKYVPKKAVSSAENYALFIQDYASAVFKTRALGIEPFEACGAAELEESTLWQFETPLLGSDPTIPKYRVNGKRLETWMHHVPLPCKELSGVIDGFCPLGAAIYCKVDGGKPCCK